jgi:hypothetical protein
MKNKKSSMSARMPLAITLIIAAFASAFFISTFSNKGDKYWVLTNAITTGHVIAPTDIRSVYMNLSSSSQNYLKSSEAVIGLVAKENLGVDEVLSVTDLTNSSDSLATSAVPLSLRSSDLASGVEVGDLVDIYWVLDSRNGEPVVDPILILGGVAVIGLDDSKNALGGEVSISVAIEETQVLRLLSATTQGRLVVVRSYV